jgi:hypothetical protein
VLSTPLIGMVSRTDKFYSPARRNGVASPRASFAGFNSHRKPRFLRLEVSP